MRGTLLNKVPIGAMVPSDCEKVKRTSLTWTSVSGCIENDAGTYGLDQRMYTLVWLTGVVLNISRVLSAVVPTGTSPNLTVTSPFKVIACFIIKCGYLPCWRQRDKLINIWMEWKMNENHLPVPSSFIILFLLYFSP